MWTGLTEMREEIVELRGRLENPEPFLQGAADTLRECFAENIRSGGRPTWPGLEPTTLEARRVDTRRPQLPGTRPLAGGALEASFTQAGARGHIERIQGKTLEIGSEFPGVHEVGGSGSYEIRPRRARALRYVGRNRAGIGWMLRARVQHPPLPARPVLTVPEATETELANGAEAYLAGETR